jgi:hypothetical protein
MEFWIWVSGLGIGGGLFGLGAGCFQGDSKNSVFNRE